MSGGQLMTAANLCLEAVKLSILNSKCITKHGLLLVKSTKILLSGNASNVTYFKVGQIFKEKQNKIIYFPIYNNNKPCRSSRNRDALWD